MMTFSQFLVEARMPRHLYHETDARSAASIMKSGLKGTSDYILHPDRRKGVNFMSRPGQTPFPIKAGVTFQVKTAHLDRSKLKNMGTGWWRYHGDVPPQHVTGPWQGRRLK